MLLFSPTFGLVEKALDASALRHKALASNIANVDTPFYKRRDVSFEAELQRAVRRGQTLSAYRTDPRHIPFKHQTLAEPQIVIDRHTTYNHNGNNVDLDVEMAELAKNQIKYHALVDRANGHFKKLKTVINEGR
ncbi:flagellar basal body rod protein FlgB [Caldalkalibacillus thermarum]|uniref:flagellar basal body rod protein FlgB n=1 Tax=Caldalkalibacillus thermarum TaxID=296745 RepID=UPI0016695D92|nr:flagellar basal body rod protein FlgB [Caldalkalibacillus thermarum]GGK13819.1 flagellar basal body rod protein FlgB [Caldalkalibacillus thermarum]